MDREALAEKEGGEGKGTDSEIETDPRGVREANGIKLLLRQSKTEYKYYNSDTI